MPIYVESLVLLTCWCRNVATAAMHLDV